MSDWDTTFYYQQELKSAYMNNIIKGLIKPGIYNLNAVLYTVPAGGETNANQGVYLKILPGATFIFSNGYDVVSGTSVLKRNLNKLGSYVVKCVANNTIDVRIASPINVASLIFDANGSGQTTCPTIFVYARFTYEEDQVANVTPSFGVAVPSSNTLWDSSPNYRLPNEDISITTADDRESYLIVGVVLDNNKVTTSGGYTDGQNWREVQGVYKGDEAWLSNHVFTARALPEYRGSLSRNYGENTPTIAFSPKYNRLFMTSGSMYFSNILHSFSGVTWRELYGQGTAENTSYPTSSTGFMEDHIYASEGATSYTPSDVSSLLTVGNANKLVLEFFFLAIRSEYSSASSEDLASLLSNTTSRKFISYRLLCNDSLGNSLNTSSELGSSYGTSGTAIVPLDTNVLNIERLKNYLKDRNILLPVVNKMRQDATSSPFLTPAIGQSLIPIGISFRKINGTGTDFTDIQSSATFSYFTKVGGATGASAVNPANFLSFLELQASSFSVLGSSINVEEVFETLPLID